jgi:hypothetical protein
MVRAVAAVATVLVLGTVVSTWQAIRAKRAETHAEAEAGLARQAEKTAREETHTARVERQRASEAAEAARQNLYAANMNLVQQAWEQNNVGQARRLLEETATYPERGFEWYYWQRQTHQALKTLRGHSADLYSVAFSPDSRRIVTGSADGTAKVWEAASGRELLTLKGHSAPINSVAFSADGQRIVTGSDDQTAKVWEASGAEQVAVWREEERAAVQDLASSEREWAAEQERQRIARARVEGAIKQWLILAPIPLATHQSGAEGLDVEQIEGEGRLRPKAGETIPIGNGELKWQDVALDDYVVDFNATLGLRGDPGVAYAVSYIRSEAEQSGLEMLVGSDDEAKVYLNGKQVHNYSFPRSFLVDQDVVPDITLNAGLNVLVLKVANEGNFWIESIRFRDAQGDPVKGIKVTLDPEAKD